MHARSALLVLVFGVALAADAQPRIGIDLGMAVPTGALGTHRSAGVAATLSAGRRAPGFSPRLDVTWTRLYGDDGPVGVGTNSGRGDYSSAGIRVSALYRSRGRGVAAYGLLGTGLYTISIERDQNPYGDVFWGSHAGVGIEVPIGVAAVSAEVSAVAMVTDYGAGALNFPTVHVPLTVGVRF
jgi:hypothetical protein